MSGALHRLCSGLALVALLAASLVEPARAQDADDEDEPEPTDGLDSDWAVERFASRFAVFQQDGTGGFQSQAGSNRHGLGSESTWKGNLRVNM